MEPVEGEQLPAGRLVEAHLVEMVFPEQTNHYGTLFGGQALSLMDKAAFIVASRYSRRTVVTARSEKCDFHVPVRQGELIEIHARGPEARTSVTMRVKSEFVTPGELFRLDDMMPISIV